jgi:DHA3 family macrolide efflux protein-like MFS transporter
MNVFNLEVLKEENALLIFISQMMTSVADKMLSLGLIWYITKNLGPEVVPWFLTMAFLPHLLFSFHSAKIIHRFKIMNTIMMTEVFRSLFLIVYFFVLGQNQLSKEVFTYSLFLMVFLMGIGSALFTPAILSCPPILVKEDKVVGLNALIDSSISISNILGAVASIFLLNIFDLRGLILINAFAFFGAYLIQLKIKTLKIVDDVPNDQANTSPLIVIKKYPDIAKMLFSFLLVNLVLTPIFVLIPWYVEKIYHGDSSSLASIEGGMGIGAFLMGIYISVTQLEVSEKNRVKMIASICFMFGLLLTLFSFTNSTWQGVGILFLIGASSTFLNIQILTFFQMSAEGSDVPAIMAAVNLISTASMPLSLTISGFIIPNVHVQTFALLCGVIVILLAFVLPPLIKTKNSGVTYDN